MSVSSEVQRTLVKSPPELWAELSDPTTLARHLGELGEVRIVRTEPESTVEWEAVADGAQASGKVAIAPSGWGTKVTLSATRLLATPKPEAIEPAPEAPAEAGLAATPAAGLSVESAAEPQPAAEAEPEPEPPIADEPEPRLGFFARIFRRRRNTQIPPELTVEPEPVVEPEPELAVEPESEPREAVEIEGPARKETAPEKTTPAEAAPDIAAELVELEQQTTAVLAGVLDRLGAAHHRPFSRA